MRFLREPLLHFALIGAAIFCIDWAIDDSPDLNGDARIVVGAGEIDRLAAGWQAKRQLPPTPDELRGLVDAYVREEVYYREALALGLDRDDSIVRSRLAQKFEFLVEDIATAREPTQPELSAYFEANLDRYRAPPVVSFTHVYVSLDRRGAAAQQDAKVMLAALRAGASHADVAGRGDRIMLDDAYSRLSTQEVEAVFGPDFAAAVFSLDVGDWSGPIASAYGLHLVRLDEHLPGRLPSLLEVEERVRADWVYDQRREANEAIFRRLLARYEVVIEEGTAGSAMSDAEQESGN